MTEESPRGEPSAVEPTGESGGPGRAGHSPIDGLYSAVIENLPETSVTVFDGSLRFRMAYGEALSFNGWTQEDLDGKTAAEVLPPQHLALLEPLFRGALAGKRASVEVPSLDGARTLWTRIAPLEDDGRIVGGVAISVDITDRKSSEEANSRLAAIVEQSRDAIVGIGLDEFTYLKELPFDCLKIDGGFIRQLTRSQVDRIAVQAMVAMAQGLEKSTIAEAVEDESTLEAVRGLGIDHAQGFHIGRPATPAA